jgi:hypothetical protein
MRFLENLLFEDLRILSILVEYDSIVFLASKKNMCCTLVT